MASNLRFETDKAIVEFCFGTTPITATIAGEKGNALIVDIKPKDVVELRDWLTGRIDWLKEGGMLPEAVTGSL